jgi:PAS domain S-box-containing protein
MNMATARRRVWIADDSSLDAERARVALGDEYVVEVFKDGALALERLAAGSSLPDVLVTDWVMPGLSGIDICRFLRASDAPLCNISVLLLTVHQRTEQLVEALAAGANDFVSKPFADAELRARVGSLVRLQVLREQLEQAEGTVRQLLTNSPDAFLAVDAEGLVVFANEEAERAFGRPASELIGMNLDALVPTDGDWKSDLETAGDVTIGERGYARSVRRSTHAGEEHWIITLRDVTEHRHEEARKLDFYSTMAHELRSPLSAALMRMELVLEGIHGPLAPALSADLHKVRRSVSELVGLVNDFLDVARNDSEAPVERERVALGQLIKESVEDYRPLAEGSSLDLSCEIPAQELYIRGDLRRLRQVMSNLVGNALKFTPPGGRVAVQLSRDGDRAHIVVTDTGPGIAEHSLATLFDRYVRAGDQASVGSGLGLMIVRQIVEAHSGSVGVRSEVGQGSSFWIRLPLM